MWHLRCFCIDLLSSKKAVIVGVAPAFSSSHERGRQKFVNGKTNCKGMKGQTKPPSKPSAKPVSSLKDTRDHDEQSSSSPTAILDVRRTRSAAVAPIPKPLVTAKTKSTDIIHDTSSDDSSEPSKNNRVGPRKHPVVGKAPRVRKKREYMSVSHQQNQILLCSTALCFGWL